MEILAETTTCVLGVDPDKARFAVAVIDSVTKGELGHESFPNNPDGFDAAMAWAEGYATETERAWAIEGSGTYGARLTRALQADGEWVIDFSFPKTPAGIDGAKSDHLDAARAAREVLGRARQVAPRSDNDRAHAAIRALVSTRRRQVAVRTSLINCLKAQLLVAPEAVIGDLEGLTNRRLVERCARFRPAADTVCCEVTATKAALRSLARVIAELNTEIDELTARMQAHINHVAPHLLQQVGVGVASAAQILVSWGHQGRIHSADAFTKLAGVAPIEATSGQTQNRHRLSRGGDRQLNTALHTIAITRARCDPRTKAYIARRVNEGKTHRDARRCIKRYAARNLYRLLENPPPTP